MKAVTGTVDHGAYNKNYEVFFLENQRGFILGKHAEISNLETINSINTSVIHAIA